MDDRGHLTTERRNARSRRLDRMSVEEAFDLINSEDATVAGSVAAARREICAAIELVVSAFRMGGRLIYVGAGTSGRLGVLDAAECPPTFLSDPSLVRGIIAGGREALVRSIEGAEDHPEDGAAAVDELDVSAKDVVLAVATGGTTAYVHGALRRAGQRGAKTVFFACVPKEDVADEADMSIRVLTGPEVLTGSTRMKAGTATKMVLNMITTISMVRTGKVYQNLMVDVNTKTNRKLVDRGIRIVSELTALSRDAARELLERADGHVKTALVMHARGVDRRTAQRMLDDAGGNVSTVVEGS
jgi:N-acetylmuramic acid 6-phosphate etherase